MQFVPWQNIADWDCKACGLLHQTLQRSFRLHGVAKHRQILRLRNHGDRFRSLLHQTHKRRLLRVPLQQNTKLLLRLASHEACKIWPFKILSEPKYGEPNQATFDYMGNRLYVYADTVCSGLRLWNANMGVPI